MCGIIGAMSSWSFSDDDKHILDNMFYLDVLRGKDSSGAIFYNAAQQETAWFKQVGLPDKLEDAEGYKTAWNGMFHSFIGHNRRATTGGVSVENAHPFQKNNIIGVHNGTLYRADVDRLSAMLTAGDVKELQGTTDSEILYAAINREGIEAAWKEVDGAVALAYFDTDAKAIYLITNGKRPLCYWRGLHERVFFASEPWILAIGISKVRNTPDVKPIRCEKNKLYKFHRTTENKNINSRIVLKEEQTVLLPFVDARKPKEFWPGYSHTGEVRHHGVATFPKVIKPATKKETPKETPKKEDVVLNDEWKQRADGSKVSKQLLEASNCSYCLTVLSMDNSVCFAKDMQLCKECDAVKDHAVLTNLGA